MRKALTGTAAALAIVATGFAAAAPADAQRYRGYGHYRGYGYHRGGGAGLAVGAGILGLAAGAAIASDRGYYGPGYYAPPPPPPGYYGAGYYGGYGYGGGCRTDWQWDGYRGRYHPVRYCY